MSEATLSIDEAYKILKEVAKERNARVIATLFIPTATLEGVLKLKSFTKVPIRAMTLHGMTEGHYRSNPVRLPNQPENIRVRKFLAPERYEVRARYENGVSINDLEELYMFALANNMVIGVRRALVEYENKLLEFKTFRPKGIENPIAKLATYIGRITPVRVLDLQKEHDLYTLKRLQEQFPHSELRICEYKITTGHMASCKFIT